MKQLTIAASAFVVALLLMMSFNANAVAGKKVRVDYSQFSHRTHIKTDKPACDSCHKFPTANWKDVRPGDAAFPDVAEFPKHETCLNCHRQQFFARQRPAPAICSNCHVNVTPRDTARFLFPSLGDVSGKPERKNVAEFAVSFPHEKHEDQECTVCHQLDKEGEVKTKPNSHTVCFSCHNVESELAPLPSTCNACHKLADAAQSSEVVLNPPYGSGGIRSNPFYKTSFSRKDLNNPPTAVGGIEKRAHAVLSRNDLNDPPTAVGGIAGFDSQMKVRDDADYSKFQHSSAYHQRLPCALCHRRDTNAVQPTIPGAKDHLPCAGCHVKQFADRSNAICTNCHTDPSTGALKPFPRLSSFNMKFDHTRHDQISCSNCHRPARGGVALSIPTGFNAHTGCFQCHGPQAKSGERDISSCGVCHEPGRYARPSQTARAFRVGFSHAQHNRDERLGCNDCHRVQANDVAAPRPLNHHAAQRSFSCMSCHNGKRAFGGDDFSVCQRCHKGSTWHF